MLSESTENYEWYLQSNYLCYIEGKDEIHNADLLMMKCGTVSYTHLDVYKRQHYTSSQLI